MAPGMVRVFAMAGLVTACGGQETPSAGAPPPVQTAAVAPRIATVSSVSMPAQRSQTDTLYTEAQAMRGKKIFLASCTGCHREVYFTGDEFVGRFGLHGPVANIFWLLRENEPNDKPGSLTDQQYVDLIAYIFWLDGMPAGSKELPPDESALMKLQFVAK